jgi:glycerol transport system substrate-binding protein
MSFKKIATRVLLALITVGTVPATVPAKNMDRWIRAFQPSVLSTSEQQAEFEWFARVAKPYKGLVIKSCSEGIPTHKWEAAVLAKAFTDLTGIIVKVDIIGEGEVVNRMTRQMETGEKTYDIYVNDADLIGTHLRADSALNFNAFIKGEGRKVTNPGLDLDDFLNLEFGQDYEGHQLQIPDQQFANLYWFRYDWFTHPKYMKGFRKKYGYELGVPLNWQAYEDIAEFFTGKVIDGRKVYGHMDYGKKSPGLGWRFTDAWLSMAGAGDKGLPNGLPVDEWVLPLKGAVPPTARLRFTPWKNISNGWRSLPRPTESTWISLLPALFPPREESPRASSSTPHGCRRMNTQARKVRLPMIRDDPSGGSRPHPTVNTGKRE